MLTWAKIALLLLQLADKLFDWLQAQKYRDEGFQKAMAEHAAAILRKSEYAKEVMARVSNLDAAATDKLLRDLEPGG